MRTRAINWENIEYNILRRFENLAIDLYICLNKHQVYWPEYHYHYMAQQLLAELKGLA